NKGKNLNKKEINDAFEDMDDQTEARLKSRYYTTNEDKLEQINSKLQNVLLPFVKYKSLVYEKQALEVPKNLESIETVTGLYNLCLYVT
ncbi:hypothetical protein BpHYR1_005782, partial [Brachionus plicatilis]